MIHPRRLLLVVALATSHCLISEARSESSEPVPDFEKEVRPILNSHCVRCHGPEKQEARIRLDTLSIDVTNDRAAAEYWHEVRNVLNAGEMPPEGEPQLDEKQRKVLLAWVTDAVRRATDAGRRTSGRVVLRRLNRAEYQNTMFDLLGLDMNYARDLPPDPPSADGFRNDGGALRMSSIQLEYYLKTARTALSRVIVSGPAPKVFRHEFTASNVKGWLGGTEWSNRLQRKQAFLATTEEYPEHGEFRVHVRCRAELRPDTGYPILQVDVGYRPDTQILFRDAGDVEITSAESQEFEFRGRLENHPLPVRGQGKFPGIVVMLRNAYTDGTPTPSKIKDKKPESYPDEPRLSPLHIESVVFEAPVFDQWPPASHRRILFDSELREADERGYVTAVLERFMRRAFRRPVDAAEVERMVAFFTSVRDEFPTFEGAIRETLAFVLIHPDFLFLMEPAGDERRTIGDWELASRLSYFLWSTMPDERLMQLAEAGTLSQSDVLTAEVERLLLDPRATRFVDQFTDQWLNLDVVDSVAVNADRYPGIDDPLKADMKQETRRFFGHLLRENLSAIHLLKSDFTLVNERLARHYGFDAIYGRTFRPIQFDADKHRGGLIGQASILLANSTGTDSHAVRRAVWIRDRLLDDPPAPPPPDVPSLDEADPSFLKLSIREQLEVHRGTQACASCHRSIDPWGIALENYDAVGLWREEIRTDDTAEPQPVQARDVLPDGTELDGADGLRSYLTEHKKDEFARSLVKRLLTYALGRRLEISDVSVIDELAKQLVEDDHRLRGLVVRIVLSTPFRTK